jgi:hypothetical protein
LKCNVKTRKKKRKEEEAFKEVNIERKKKIKGLPNLQAC